MDVTLARFRDKFIDEANGLLDQLETDLLELEKNPDNQELIESAFRSMHTIKGVSGMYAFNHIADYTHLMESIYQTIREKKAHFSREVFEITFQAIDHLRKLLMDEKLDDLENQKNHAILLQRTGELNSRLLQSVENNEDEIPDSNISAQVDANQKAKIGYWHILLQTSEQLFFRGISLVNLFRELAQHGEFQVQKMPFLSSSTEEVWSILLKSDAEERDIRDVFIFIEDDCKFVFLGNSKVPNMETKLFGTDSTTQTASPSILEMIEESGYYIEPEVVITVNEQAKCESDSAEKPNLARNNKSSQANSQRIPVDASKLDLLMYLVSELITVNSQLQISTREGNQKDLTIYFEKIDSLSKLFRNNALDIRLIPLDDMLLRFQRLIRDLSKQLNKKVELRTHGTDTELDKGTIDQLNEPLMHIIRNCIDHGIEDPSNRLEKGKPETGTIKISAHQSGNFIFISIQDDGNGINLERVKQKAIDKGYLKPDDKPTVKEIYDLVFLPGFSTAQSLTEVSGRGVGMDVVRKKIQDLRGEIMVDSKPGIGTTFTLKIQQSLAIIDTLLFKVDNNYFTVPINDIEICNQISREEIDKRKHTGTLAFNNELIPMVNLRHLFNMPGDYNGKTKAIILRNSDNCIALLVDTIEGEHQAVLKPLGRSFHNQRFITSASQLGDGHLAFMLDTSQLFKDILITTSI